MPQSDDRPTRGIYFPPGERDLPDKAFNVFSFRGGSFSLSDEMRHAIRMHIEVQRTLDAIGIGRQYHVDKNEAPPVEQQKRAWVTQAIREKAQRDFNLGDESSDDTDTDTDDATESEQDTLDAPSQTQ